MEIDQQYLDTLVMTTGGNRSRPWVGDYLRGIQFLLGTPNNRLGKRDFCRYLAILKQHGKTFEINFWTTVLEQNTIGYPERHLLNHFRVYCIYIQFLQICRVNPEDPLCMRFCQELMASYTKAKKAYTDAQNC